VRVEGCVGGVDVVQTALSKGIGVEVCEVFPLSVAASSCSSFSFSFHPDEGGVLASRFWGWEILLVGLQQWKSEIWSWSWRWVSWVFLVVVLCDVGGSGGLPFLLRVAVPSSVWVEGWWLKGTSFLSSFAKNLDSGCLKPNSKVLIRKLCAGLPLSLSPVGWVLQPTGVLDGDGEIRGVLVVVLGLGNSSRVTLLDELQDSSVIVYRLLGEVGVVLHSWWWYSQGLLSGAGHWTGEGVFEGVQYSGRTGWIDDDGTGGC
jgi:hypothetical protein